MQPPFDIAADLDTPVSAYLKLEPFNPRFLLESVERGQQLARYSFLGLGDTLRVRLDEQGVRINGTLRARPADASELLGVLREALELTPALEPAVEGLPFSGGLVGAAAYDLVRFFERLPDKTVRDPRTADAIYIAPASLLVFDHLTRTVALLHSGSEAERLALKREIVKALSGSLPARNHRPSIGPASASLSEEKFKSAVRRTQRYIRDGDVYQLVLSVRYSGLCDLSPFETYRALRLLNPSPYMFFCDLGEVVVVGSSPEAMVKLRAREASLRPIAGTRPRATDAREDEARAADLLADPKENAEHVMLVDLARNDLGRVVCPGSIRVSPFRSIERYSHVMHMVSGVTGALEARADALDLFASAFPAGTLVGAPKVRAMELIEELEPLRRGFYGGAVGYFNHCGDMDQAIAIRTLIFQGDEYHYQAGAGIVMDSDPGKEYEEVLAKSAVLRRALSLAAEGL